MEEEVLSLSHLCHSRKWCPLFSSGQLSPKTEEFSVKMTERISEP